jgi:hypothetical protein
MYTEGELNSPKLGTVRYALTDANHVYIHTKELNVGPLLTYRGNEYYLGLHLYRDTSGNWGTQSYTDCHVARWQGKVSSAAQKAIQAAATEAWVEFIKDKNDLRRQANIGSLGRDISRLDDKIVEARLALQKLEKERAEKQAELDRA